MCGFGVCECGFVGWGCFFWLRFYKVRLWRMALSRRVDAFVFLILCDALRVCLCLCGFICGMVVFVRFLGQGGWRFYFLSCIIGLEGWLCVYKFVWLVSLEFVCVIFGC